MADVEILLAEDEAQHQHAFAPLPSMPAPSLPRRLLARVSGKVWYRFGWVCPCNARWLPLVERVMLARGIIDEEIDYFQLNYHPGFGGSVGTHDKGKPVDTAQCDPEHIVVWRWAGGDVQRRYPPFQKHGHGGPWGCRHGSKASKAQDVQWTHRQNGLIGHGPVEGPWPVVNWKTGIKRMETEITKFADEIVTKTTKAVLAEVAHKVWATDDQIANIGFTANVKNPGLAAKSAVEETFREITALRSQVRAQDAKIAAQDAKLDAILAALTPVPPVA
jgi:hypothetical protein